MADAYKKFTADGVQIAATVTTVFTAAAGSGSVVREIVVVNTDTVDRTFALYRNGATSAHLITPAAVPVPAGGQWTRDCCSCFAPTDTLRAIASVASKLNITVSGDEVT